MPTANQSAAMKLYSRLLHEARSRIELLEALLGREMQLMGKPPSGWITREFCFLQLRMLCELIALGCLVAHGDISATHAKRLRKEYSADAIMSEMTKLHPMFFPVAVVQQINAAGNSHFIADRSVESFTQDELCKLYGQCGGGLHKGTIEKIITPIEPNPDNSDLMTWTKKIHGLLSIHMIYLISGDSYMIGWLRRKQSGKSGVAFASNVPSS